jgi:streptogramin lyase
LGAIQKIENKSDSSYKITEFDVGVDSYPAGLFLQRDHVWISHIQNHKLIKFNIIRDNNGIVKDVVNALEIPSNDNESIYLPTDLLISDSNSVWFTEHGTSTITNYQMSSSHLTRFPTSTNQYQTTTLPFWIRESADGQGFWFNEHTGNRIGFFDTTQLVLTEYEIPTRPSDGYIVYPLGVAVDPADSKKLWFSEWNTDKIAVVDRSIPIPFDIRSDVKKVVLSGYNDTVKIHIQIIKNDNIDIQSHNKIVSPKVSSSMEPAAGLVNMTSFFSAENIDLTKITKSTTLQLTLQNHYAPFGNYILAVSATDGSVTKSIFLDLVIE